MKVSPVVIRVMLACYYSTDPVHELGALATSSAGVEAFSWLKSKNLIDENCRSTDRGDAWVNGLLQTPLPESVWVIPTPQELVRAFDQNVAILRGKEIAAC